MCISSTHKTCTYLINTYYWLLSRSPFHKSTLQVAGFLSLFLSYSDSWPVKMGPIRCPETSVNNYHTTPRNIPEERRSHAILSSNSMKVRNWNKKTWTVPLCKVRDSNLPMSLRDSDVHTFVISHSYRSTCLSNSAICDGWERRDKSLLSLYEYTQQEVLSVYWLQFLYTRLPAYCVWACVRCYSDLKMPTVVGKKRCWIFWTWFWRTGTQWNDHRTVLGDWQVRIDISRIE
jgi:hypothetical protein